jgi:penicillin-binding protein 1A
MQLFINKKIIVFIVLLAGMAAGGLFGAFFAFTRDLPQIQTLETFRPQAVTRIYSTDKQLLAEQKGTQFPSTVCPPISKRP